MHDQGGNLKRVSARGLHAGQSASLLGHRIRATARRRSTARQPDGLLAQISAADIKAWQRGGPADWARESFSLAKP